MMLLCTISRSMRHNEKIFALTEGRNVIFVMSSESALRKGEQWKRHLRNIIGK